jgi:hypothetical protein
LKLENILHRTAMALEEDDDWEDDDDEPEDAQQGGISGRKG